jgi:prepilin-type processing-associated H-X9-DG protein
MVRAMEDHLVGYVLDCLDDKSKREVEAYLQAHSEARQRVAQLRQALAPLALDQEPETPPSGLALRTLVKVAEHICTQQEWPRAPTLKFETPAVSRPWWRRADALIAACLLLTVTGVILPALLIARGKSTVILCQNNLRQFYTALQAYRNNQPDHSYPDIERLPEPRNVAGMVVPILADAGVLPEGVSIRCPGDGEPLASAMPLQRLRDMTAEEFQRYAPLLSHSYAYSLGYRDEVGYHSPGSNPHVSSDLIPVMADRATAEDSQANSSNHSGHGQNILYADGHIVFHTARTILGDDIYLNRQNRVAAGLDPNDAVLGASSARP